MNYIVDIIVDQIVYKNYNNKSNILTKNFTQQKININKQIFYKHYAS